MEPVNLFDLAAQQAQLAGRAPGGGRRQHRQRQHARLQAPWTSSPSRRCWTRRRVALAATAGRPFRRRARPKPASRCARTTPSESMLPSEEHRGAGKRDAEGRRGPPRLRAQHRHREGLPPHDDDERRRADHGSACHRPQGRRLRPRRPVRAPAHRLGKPRQRPVDRRHARLRSLSPQDHHLRRRARPRQRRLDWSRSRTIDRDQSDFPIEFMPGNEAADENGYVKMPNVNVLIEMADMTRGQPLLRGQSPGHQAGARPDLDDHRPDERPVMIGGIGAARAQACHRRRRPAPPVQRRRRRRRRRRKPAPPSLGAVRQAVGNTVEHAASTPSRCRSRRCRARPTRARSSMR